MRSNARPLVIVRVAVCLAALLSQGTLLPLAHAGHELKAAANEAASRVVASGGTDNIHRRQPVSRTHDASRCILCAAFAHSRNGVVSLGVRAPALQTTPEVLKTRPVVWSGTTSPLVTRPRAPPSLAS